MPTKILQHHFDNFSALIDEHSNYDAEQLAKEWVKNCLADRCRVGTYITNRSDEARRVYATMGLIEAILNDDYEIIPDSAYPGDELCNSCRLQWDCFHQQLAMR